MNDVEIGVLMRKLIDAIKADNSLWDRFKDMMEDEFPNRCSVCGAPNGGPWCCYESYLE